MAEVVFGEKKDFISVFSHLSRCSCVNDYSMSSILFWSAFTRFVVLHLIGGLSLLTTEGCHDKLTLHVPG